ncbi:hypothetical protein HDV05_007259 [Chytridiales sp. JEL 0842]|nr:hypothetical protein HDV05_007259 [Chytridiales sp. JEL 0842]
MTTETSSSTSSSSTTTKQPLAAIEYNPTPSDSSSSSSGIPHPYVDPSEEGWQFKLDKLGPIVVNEDGTMARITGWDKMTDIEKERTVRVLNKRNQARLKKLKEQLEREGGSAAGGGQ